MAKQQQRKASPARRATRNDDARLIESAKSLARVIGSLQRQLRETLPDFDVDDVPVKNRPARATPNARAKSAPTPRMSSAAPANNGASKSPRGGSKGKARKR